jgi:hypothetical protein
MQSQPQSQHTAAAHDQDLIRFGRLPRSSATYPFSTREYVHLLVLRSRVQAGLYATDDLCAG